MKTWYNINAKDEGAVDVQILEEIGGYGVNGQAFMDELKAKCGDSDRPINLLINSPGGSVIEGNFIYNELVSLKNTVTAEISGMAASMASIIAMAADKVAIHENSYLMIHNPWTLAMGDSEDLRKMADLMDGMKQSAIKAYQRHTDMSEEAIAELMDEETWMTGEEAVNMGFADEMLEPLEVAASAKEIPESIKAMVMAEAPADVEEPAEVEEEPAEEEAEDAGNDTEDQPEVNAEPDVQEVADEVDAHADTTTDCRVGEAEEPATAEPESSIEIELSPQYIALLADNVALAEKLEKQTEVAQKLQSERDKVRAELEKAKADHEEQITNAIAESSQLKERLSKIAAPGFSFDGEAESVATWRDAYEKLGYEEARKQHPELYAEFMNKKK